MTVTELLNLLHSWSIRSATLPADSRYEKLRLNCIATADAIETLDSLRCREASTTRILLACLQLSRAIVELECELEQLGFLTNAATAGDKPREDAESES